MSKWTRRSTPLSLASTSTTCLIFCALYTPSSFGAAPKRFGKVAKRSEAGVLFFMSGLASMDTNCLPSAPAPAPAPAPPPTTGCSGCGGERDEDAAGGGGGGRVWK